MSKSPLFYAALAGISLVGSAVCVMAQDAPAPKERPQFPGRERGELRRPDHMMGPNANGMVFVRMLSNPSFIKDLGLPEDTAKKIIDSLAKIDEQEKALYKERGDLMRKQTELIAGLMSDRTKSTDEARKAVADLAALSTKLGELSIERMLVVRDNLSDEQIKKASESVKDSFRKRREEMKQRFGGPKPEGAPNAQPPTAFGPKPEGVPHAEQPAAPGPKPEVAPEAKPEAAPPPPPPAPEAK